MIRSLYDWTLRQAQHPRALWVLAVVAFVEILGLSDPA